MTKPQQPGRHRSGHGPSDPASAKRKASDEVPKEDRGGGPVPEENQPGHHPEHEQDKPSGESAP